MKPRPNTPEIVKQRFQQVKGWYKGICGKRKCNISKAENWDDIVLCKQLIASEKIHICKTDWSKVDTVEYRDDYQIEIAYYKPDVEIDRISVKMTKYGIIKLRVPVMYKDRAIEVAGYIRDRVYPQVKFMKTALQGFMKPNEWGLGIVLQKSYSKHYEDVVYINPDTVKWLQNKKGE